MVAATATAVLVVVVVVDIVLSVVKSITAFVHFGDGSLLLLLQVVIIRFVFVFGGF